MAHSSWHGARTNPLITSKKTPTPSCCRLHTARSTKTKLQGLAPLHCAWYTHLHKICKTLHQHLLVESSLNIAILVELQFLIPAQRVTGAWQLLEVFSNNQISFSFFLPHPPKTRSNQWWFSDSEILFREPELMVINKIKYRPTTAGSKQWKALDRYHFISLIHRTQNRWFSDSEIAFWKNGNSSYEHNQIPAGC